MLRFLHTSLNSPLILKKPKLEIINSNKEKYLVLTLYKPQL